VPRRTADDRSKEVTLYGLRTDPGRWLRPSVVPRAQHARIARRAKALAAMKRKSSAAASGAAGVYISGMLGVMYGYRQLSPEYPRLAAIGAAGIMGALTAFLLYLNSKNSVLTPFVVIAFLEERRCASCGHDLTGCTPQEDACTVCPECGAAWRLTPGA
jgi:hypothetical protein